MVVQFQAAVAPFELIALVADGEVEALEAALDRVFEKLAQVQRARPEVGGAAVFAIVRQHVIVAAAEHDARVVVARAELENAKTELAAARWFGRLQAQRAVGRAQDRLNDVLDEGAVGGPR